MLDFERAVIAEVSNVCTSRPGCFRARNNPSTLRAALYSFPSDA